MSTTISEDVLTPDSYINEISEWVDKIYEITEEDYVHGGEHGFSNVPHEQLSNRTLYLKNTLEELTNFVNNLQELFDAHKVDNLSNFSELRVSIHNLSNLINSLQQTINNNDDNYANQFNDLLQQIQDLNTAINNLETNYAASDKQSGDALGVATQKVFNTELNIVGVDNTSPNKLKYNTSVIIDKSTIKATTFQGNLDGEAKTAKQLSNKVNVTLYGDVTGTIKFDGSEDVKIDTKISSQEDIVATAVYGPGNDLTILPGDVFYVPEFTVSKSGLITKVANREITLNLDPDVVNKTINNDNTDDKILLIGTLNQGTRQKTYSNPAVFEKEGKLYSQYNEVVDVESEQNLNNKTINGLEIKEAASREVDDTPGGTLNSNKLVSSDAFARHTHNYAEAIDGKAKEVIIDDNTNKDGYIVTNIEDNKIGIDNNLIVKSGGIQAKTLEADSITAKNFMKIPGGKIWIEPVSGEGISGITPDMEEILKEMNDMKRIIASLDTDTIHKSKINRKQVCSPLQLLSYSSGTYWLADNRYEIRCQNIVLSLTNSDSEHNIEVLTYGTYILPNNNYDGCGCYIGEDGNILFERPYKENAIVKKVGYVAKNKLIFRPEDSNIDYVVSTENRTWEHDAGKNLIPVIFPRAKDVMWEQDFNGDFIPCKGEFSNELWETIDLIDIVPVGEGETPVSNDCWEKEGDNNLQPKEQEFVWDLVWEVDESFDLVASLNNDNNECWENIYDGITPIGEGIVITNDCWEIDDIGNLMPKDLEFVYDKVWECDECFDLVSTEFDDENELWNITSDGIVPNGDGREVFNESWEVTNDGHVTPLDQEFGYNDTWEYDEMFDIVLSDHEDRDSVWENFGSEAKVLR